MSDLSPVTHSVDADGVGWIVFDNQAARANVVNPPSSPPCRLRLTPWPIRQAQGSLANGQAVVVTSAKERIFMAGGRPQCWPDWPDVASATRVSREGQELFGRLASFKVRGVRPPRRVCRRRPGDRARLRVARASDARKP